MQHLEKVFDQIWKSFEICIISFTVSSPVSFFFNIHNVRYTYVKCKHFYCHKIQLPRKVPSLSYTHTHTHIYKIFVLPLRTDASTLSVFYNFYILLSTVSNHTYMKQDNEQKRGSKRNIVFTYFTFLRFSSYRKL